MITAVIVEDSRLARLELSSLLARIPDVQLVGEAENVDDAKALIEEKRPQLIFLDINLPEKDGFELLLSLDDVPAVIFTTAYDQYAIKAFEFNTLDYLLKPVTAERLEQAIDKLRKQSRSDDKEKVDTDCLTESSQFFVKDGEKCWLIKVGQVHLMESIGNYTRIHFDGYKPMIYKPLSKIQDRLGKGLFFRANRSQLVNLKYIQAVDTSVSGGLELTLESGDTVEVSRRQSTEFKTIFSL